MQRSFSIVRAMTGGVKRWSGGDRVQRWAVAALVRVERKFKRVKGYREIPKLIPVAPSAPQKTLDRKEGAAYSTKGRDNVLSAQE